MRLAFRSQSELLGRNLRTRSWRDRPRLNCIELHDTQNDMLTALSDSGWLEEASTHKSAKIHAGSFVLWPWPLTFWPQNKLISTIHRETFLRQVWRSKLHRIFEISRGQTDSPRNGALKNPISAVEVVVGKCRNYAQLSLLRRRSGFILVLTTCYRNRSL